MFYSAYKATHSDAIVLLAQLLLPVASGMDRANICLRGAIHAVSGSRADIRFHRHMVDCYWQEIERTLPAPLPQTQERRPGRWRVGFIDVSGAIERPWYYRSSIGGSLAALSNGRCEAFFYLSGVASVPKDLQRDVEHVRLFADCDALNEAAALVAEDELDALLLISGFHSFAPLKLLASHPARRQALWHHTHTTYGPELFDAVIVDETLYTDAYAANICEPAIVVPGAAVLLAPVFGALALAPAPHRRNGSISFGVFNRISKITPHMVRLWNRITLETPGSVIHFANAQLFNDDHFAQLMALLADCNFDMGRAILHRDPGDFARYLSFYNEVDIQLDTYPFNGGIVTVESLWHGVPVVTRADDTPQARSGLLFLSHLGLSELVAFDDDAYIGIASALARDSARLTDLRATLRDRFAASPLMDRDLFAKNFAEALQRLLTYPVRRRSQ